MVSAARVGVAGAIGSTAERAPSFSNHAPEHAGPGVQSRQSRTARVPPGRPARLALRRQGYQSPNIFCFSSRRCWASSDSVAVGRASRRARPMGSPVSSQ